MGTNRGSTSSLPKYEQALLKRIREVDTLDDMIPATRDVVSAIVAVGAAVLHRLDRIAESAEWRELSGDPNREGPSGPEAAQGGTSRDDLPSVE